MNCSYILQCMIFATIILINTNNTIHTMEKELTENQKLLKAIEEDLPKDVQTIIHKNVALLKMSDFFFNVNNS